MTNPQVKRVLVSVTDKTGVVEFARALHEEFGAEIISTGGTAKVIAEAGVDVTPIDAVTNFPEMMDGRVKTLHPRVPGGLLAKRITDIPGSSAVFRTGLVTYANATKTRLLGVPEDMLREHGAVSEEVARCMAEEARARAGADYGIVADLFEAVPLLEAAVRERK